MTLSPVEVPVPTSYGDGRLVRWEAPSPTVTIVLSHGAGAGIDTRDLAAIATQLPERGISVLLFEQPWRVAGRPLAGAPATLDVGLRAAVEVADVEGPLIVGGRSAGARSAVRTAREVGAVGAVALAFPLHPPGKPERSRADELAAAGVPTLVVQGERDTFGRPEEFDLAVLPHVELATVPGADHGFKVPVRHETTQEEALARIVDAVAEWTGRFVG